MNAAQVIDLYWQHLNRTKRIGPRGTERPGPQRSNIRFDAWLRVVTEPDYPEYEKFLKGGYPSEFEQILEESLKFRPFNPTQEEDKTDLNGALIPLEAKRVDGGFLPVSAATEVAGVAVQTIHNWIAKGLKHEKRGAYYWVSVADLSRFMKPKKRHRIIKHRARIQNSTQKSESSCRLAS